MDNKPIISKKRAAEKRRKAKVSRELLQSPAPGQLLIVIDGKAKSLSPKDLLNGETFAEWQDRCNAAHAAVVFHINHLLDFTGQERFNVLDFIASLNVRPKFVVEANAGPGDDLLAAILDLMPETREIDKFARAKAAALETAAMFHPDVLEVVCSRVVQAMRKRGVTGARASDLARDARKIADQIDRSRTQSHAPETPRLVREVLPEAPVPPETKVPTDWDLTEAGVRSSREGVVGDISAPTAIAGRGRDAARGTEYVCLVWFREGVWRRRIVEREVLANTQKILALAAFGLPVTSNNARLMVQYIADFEAANIEKLPTANVSRKLGFQESSGECTFLWGRAQITADGVQGEGDLDQLATDDWVKRPVHFQGADEGDEQIAAGFHAMGSYKGWLKAMRVVASYPKVRLAFYAALAAPLLAILRAANFILDYAGETTSGKTVTLRVAASAFGNPDEQSTNSRPSAMATWDATAVWKERAPAVLNNMAFILDDTKKAHGPEDVARTVYMFAQGRGRGRGTTKGTAGQETFNSVMISSGEQAAVSFTKDGGTLARAITAWGSPFGEKNEVTGQMVRRLNNQIMQHYGHAGPRFVQYLLEHKERWRDWREAYRKAVEIFEQRAGDNALAGRLASCFAAISITAFLAHDALDLPWAYSDPVLPLWSELVKEAKDRAAAALQHVMAWAYAHVEDFFGRRKVGASPPTLGWAGRWDGGRSSGGSTWTEIAFLPIRIHAVLRDEGYEPDSVIRIWKGRGWLHTQTDKDGTVRTERRTRLGRDNPRMVVITRAAVREAEKAT
jgi:putative DNA primase/helicase